MAVEQASRCFIRAEAGSQGMVKVGSEANIASVSGAAMTTSAHSASAVNLAMTTSTPSLAAKVNNVSTAPTITVTNLVTVVTDVRTLVNEVVDSAYVHEHIYRAPVIINRKTNLKHWHRMIDSKSKLEKV